MHRLEGKIFDLNYAGSNRVNFETVGFLRICHGTMSESGGIRKGLNVPSYKKLDSSMHFRYSIEFKENLQLLRHGL